jgi:hypothetical protein
MKYQHSNYEPWYRKKSDSSADIMANACESVLRKCASSVRHTLLGSRKLLIPWRLVVFGPCCTSESQAKFTAEINIHFPIIETESNQLR